MNRQDLEKSVSEMTGMTEEESKRAIQALLYSIGNALKSGEKVILVGFGSFSVEEYPEHMGINPQTRNKIIVPARKRVKWKSAKKIFE